MTNLDLISISDAARLSGLSADWLRRSRTVVQPVMRLADGTRLYSRSDVERFAQERERKREARG